MSEARRTGSSSTSKENVGEQRTSGQSIQRRQPREEGLAVPGMAASPFQLMRRMSDEVDRLFDRVFGDFGFGRPFGLTRSPFAETGFAQAMWTPRIEAFQKGDKLIVRAELPGMKKDDVEVNVTEDAVVIRGERKEEHERREEGFFHSERSYGNFYRTVPLPEGVITDSARATFKDGILEIELQAPPSEVSRGRKVEIQEASGQK